MSEIHVLDSVTIDKIAAGEVVERPLSVVKELVENAIDAGAGMITVEIKDGGISMIRVSDDGCGIDQSQVEKAFLRHATSKITSSDDLTAVTSLGFRGEALSSICAVCQVELITKTKEAFTGTRVQCSGGSIQAPVEVGAPDGTTVVVRNIFYNTPARQKFLKSKTTEGTYISDLMQHLALSRPDIAFKFIQNGQTRFFTSGNGDVGEIIYRIYGKDVSENIIFAKKEIEGLTLRAYLGKPVLNRSSRAFETFFVNGRYIKSKVLSNVLEEGYKNHLMQHKFPFAI
ncbi:MAG: DNA mismatch repair endonuclease MutL, partial [Lachnospiraceae bacterium]|nr:DNA mismatch repair endonuclease MutL [Lachnospiraceae bacterium]